MPTDLAEVVDSWDALSPEIRAEVLGLIRSDFSTGSAGEIT
jgi:hypothetical protein